MFFKIGPLRNNGLDHYKTYDDICLAPVCNGLERNKILHLFPASQEQYRWGANGQLMSVTNEHGEAAFQYDDAQRLVGEQQRHAAVESGSG